MSALDIGYSADRIAFREFIKYRSLSEIFSDLERIENIYKKAFSICGDDDYFYQQKAIFYMRSARQNYNEAEELLFLAQKHGPYNSTIKHTLAELELIKASKSSGLERERHYNKADTLASFYTGAQSTSSHGYDTILKVAISRLEDAISNEDEELITESTRKAEKSLREALQKYPDDEMLLGDEVKLAKLLSDSERAFDALKRSFARNHSNSYLAASLSNIYIKKGMINEAKEVLSKVLDSSPADKLVHAKLGMLLIEHFPEDSLGAEHHFRRSFTQGDTNHINQLWYARQLYINNEYDDYLLLIRSLKTVAMGPDSKHKVRGIVKDHNGKNLNLVGKVVKIEHTYALLESSGYKGAHFLHRSNSVTSKFKSLKVGTDVCYNLGFTFSGAAAILKNGSV